MATYNGNTDLSGIRLLTGDIINFDYSGSIKELILNSGIYLIECWGAQGGWGRTTNTTTNSYPGGNGGYVSGNIVLNQQIPFYICVGGAGGNAPRNTGGARGYNGGGLGGWDLDSSTGTSYKESGGGGGGATDLRLIGGLWNNIESLRSRIIVASGGGGSCSNTDGTLKFGSPGGALIGNGQTPYVVIPNQTTTRFGYGDDGFVETSSSRNYGGGGGHGSGYYGGITGTLASDIGGSGGSEFISGYEGCNAIDINGNPTNQPIHYSNLLFYNMIMKSGNESIPNPRGNGIITGNIGNGYLRVTVIQSGPKQLINDKNVNLTLINSNDKKYFKTIK